MEEGISEDETRRLDDLDASPFSHRSPSFSKVEIRTLIDLIDKHKNIILNKSTSAAASHAKTMTWVKIAKAFNSQAFKHNRTADCLKTKWDNLKKDARRLSKNVIDMKYNEFGDPTNQIVVMLCEAENNTSSLDLETQLDLDDVANDCEEHHEGTEENLKNTLWDECEDKQSDDSVDGDNENGRINRSLNFSPQECSLLLKCVREERKYVFSKEASGKALKLKNRAWRKITESFNKQSPQKRTTKVLRTKFNNMKRLAKSVSFKDYFRDSSRKHEKLVNESSKNIKSEPETDSKADLDTDVSDTEHRTEFLTNSEHSTNDPLSTVFNSDSGLGFMNNANCCNQSENDEVTKLKLKLLNYQMETAKLERKRIEDIIQADALERESRALETSLRLRAARLNAVSAEGRLPPSHPALRYPAEEARAHPYITQYQT